MIGTSRVAAQLPADVVAGAVGQHHVQQHQVGLGLAAPLERLRRRSPATSLSKPSRARASVSGSVIERSSSTIRTVRLPPAIASMLGAGAACPRRLQSSSPPPSAARVVVAAAAWPEPLRRRRRRRRGRRSRVRAVAESPPPRPIVDLRVVVCRGASVAAGAGAARVVCVLGLVAGTGDVLGRGRLLVGRRLLRRRRFRRRLGRLRRVGRLGRLVVVVPAGVASSPPWATTTAARTPKIAAAKTMISVFRIRIVSSSRRRRRARRRHRSARPRVRSSGHRCGGRSPRCCARPR